MIIEKISDKVTQVEMIEIMDNRVEEELNLLKELLRDTVKRYDYNFSHPDVVAISQKLDRVIISILNDHFKPMS